MSEKILMKLIKLQSDYFLFGFSAIFCCINKLINKLQFLMIEKDVRIEHHEYESKFI